MPLDASRATIASTSASLDTSARIPPSGGLRSATTTVAPSRSSPSAIARPIPCAPPVTIATLPRSSHEPLTVIGENEVGTRIRFHCVCRSGCSRARNACQRSSACSSARRALALAVALVAPEADDRGELADVDREPAEQVAEVLLLERDPLLLVQLHDLGQLARDHVVGALLDDHVPIL